MSASTSALSQHDKMLLHSTECLSGEVSIPAYPGISAAQASHLDKWRRIDSNLTTSGTASCPLVHTVTLILIMNRLPVEGNRKHQKRPLPQLMMNI
jgi:hypothetical protein